jgi:hypothetical protein
VFGVGFFFAHRVPQAREGLCFGAFLENMCRRRRKAFGLGRVSRQMGFFVNNRLVPTDTRRVNFSSGVPHEGLWQCRRGCSAQGAGIGSTSEALGHLLQLNKCITILASVSDVFV